MNTRCMQIRRAKIDSRISTLNLRSTLNWLSAVKCWNIYLNSEFALLSCNCYLVISLIKSRISDESLVSNGTQESPVLNDVTRQFESLRADGIVWELSEELEHLSPLAMCDLHRDCIAEYAQVPLRNKSWRKHFAPCELLLLLLLRAYIIRSKMNTERLFLLTDIVNLLRISRLALFQAKIKPIITS